MIMRRLCEWIVLTIIVLPCLLAGASSPASPLRPSGASHEAAAGEILERERRRGGGVLVKDLTRLAEGNHPNSTVAEANQKLWESSEKGRCDEIWLQVVGPASLDQSDPSFDLPSLDRLE